MEKKHWRDLTPTQRGAIEAAGTVQVVLAVAAWVDLAFRPSEGVRGPKWRWALLIAVNFVGPLAYLIWGRRGRLGRPSQPTLLTLRLGPSFIR